MEDPAVERVVYESYVPGVLKYLNQVRTAYHRTQQLGSCVILWPRKPVVNGNEVYTDALIYPLRNVPREQWAKHLRELVTFYNLFALLLLDATSTKATATLDSQVDRRSWVMQREPRGDLYALTEPAECQAVSTGAFQVP